MEIIKTIKEGYYTNGYEIIEYENIKYHRLFNNYDSYQWYTVNNEGFIVGIPYIPNLEKEYQQLIRKQKLNNILNENY
jgi:hypothetical protein